MSNIIVKYLEKSYEHTKKINKSKSLIHHGLGLQAYGWPYVYFFFVDTNNTGLEFLALMPFVVLNTIPFMAIFLSTFELVRDRLNRNAQMKVTDYE